MRFLKPASANFAGLLVFAIVLSASAQGHKQTIAPAVEPQPGSHVVFSRSIGNSPPPSPQVPGPPAPPRRSAPAHGTAIDRQGIRFDSYDLDIHLDPARGAIAVRARMVLRNDGANPRRQLPLQLSSSLEWQNLEIDGKPAPFTEETIASDEDHTGELREAVIHLPGSWKPGETLAVAAAYRGVIQLTSRRLQQIGTPPEVADRSDWDRIAPNFVGLRGFGNVVWYPVVSAPVVLGDGDKFFREADRQYWNGRDTAVSMRVTVEYSGKAPALAVLDGHPVEFMVKLQPLAGDVPGVATAVLPRARLEFAAPSLFVLQGPVTDRDGIQVVGAEPGAGAQPYFEAAKSVRPLVKTWLGGQPRRKLTIVHLPEEGDASYEDGATLFISNESADPAKLAGMMAHGLAHAYFRSPYPWLNEGAVNFLGTLWLERTSGRETALARLDNLRGALALAEPANPSPGVGESLVEARDPIYYRTKATYVFWMLRDLVGEETLARAFALYDSAADSDGTGFENALNRAGAGDLHWFFDDWVYHDRGLPDLSIAGVYPRTSSIQGSYIVAVTVMNQGTAAAEVPVSVRSSLTKTGTRLIVPANSSATHRFLLNGKPIEATVNDGTVPEVRASIHRREIENTPSD